MSDSVPNPIPTDLSEFHMQTIPTPTRCDGQFVGLPGQALTTPGTAQCALMAGHDGQHEVTIQWGQIQCPDCAGTGWRVLRRSGSVTIDCGTCDGTGRVDG